VENVQTSTDEKEKVCLFCAGFGGYYPKGVLQLTSSSRRDEDEVMLYDTRVGSLGFFWSG